METQNLDENKLPECCKPKDAKGKGLISGLIYGTIPHAGCIAFILFSLLGVTFAASIFRPLLAKAYFFYIMIGVSLVFASMSAFFYLRMRGGIGAAGKHKGYLGILYGSTIGISIILYMFVFPLLANVSAVGTGNVIAGEAESIKLKVSIPCPGHAPLIIDELGKLDGIGTVKFSFPNYFYVTYDASKISEKQIMSIDIFKEYAAAKVN